MHPIRDSVVFVGSKESPVKEMTKKQRQVKMLVDSLYEINALFLRIAKKINDEHFMDEEGLLEEWVLIKEAEKEKNVVGLKALLNDYMETIAHELPSTILNEFAVEIADLQAGDAKVFIATLISNAKRILSTGKISTADEFTTLDYYWNHLKDTSGSISKEALEVEKLLGHYSKIYDKSPGRD